jgi:hypothetical protein
MVRPADHDGKSTSATAVDGRHYPDLEEDPISHPAEAPTYADIATRAHQLWLEQGQPPDSSERNWLEAERELKAAANSRRLVKGVHQRSGSVQP